MSGQEPRLVYESAEWEIDLDRREMRSQGIPVPIGSRAFDIMEVMVRSAGEIVSKDELMASVWPGVIVEENTLHVHISAVRKALGPDRGMLKTAMGRGYRLLGTWTVQQDRSSAAVPPGEVAPMSAQASQSNLPASITDVIGRSIAVRQLQDLLSAYRMVTLTGPGGIGKTALALEVARSLYPNLQGDGWLVELASISDPSLVPSAVASTVGLKLGADTSAEAIARSIGEKKLLLVIDNCEHVVDAAAELAEMVLRLCPRTTILATSREVLRIAGEHVYRVPPLDVPPEYKDEPTNLLEHSAVQLFIARAKALNRDFSPEGDNLATVATVCRRLDGIPLAIEFAAARAAVLGISRVATHLDDRFGLLVGGRRTALPRHQTLRATLDWSYELLPAAEQSLLRHLAVFAGGFTLEAAAAVTLGSANNLSLIAEGVSNLVSKSLVTLDSSASVGRWRLLETIRIYALEKLTEHNEAAGASRRHAEYFRDLMAPFGLQPVAEEISGHEREISNVRAALDWALSSTGDPAIGVALTAAYVPVWMHLRFMVEGYERTERALNRLEPLLNLDASISNRLHLAHGITLIFTLRSAVRCREALVKALEGARKTEDLEIQVLALWALWILHLNTGESHNALSVASEFAETAERISDPGIVLIADRLIGSALHFGARHSEARHHFERLLERYVAPQDQRFAAWLHYDQLAVAQAMLARVLALQGFVDQALVHTRASTEAAMHARPSIYEVLRLATIPVTLMTGDVTAAEEATQTLLNLASAGNAPFWVNLAHCFDATLRIERGEFEIGTKLLRAALDKGEETGWTVCQPEFLGALARGMAGLGRVSEACAIIEQALSCAARGGETYYVAELLRIKGDLFILQGEDASRSEGEDCLCKALNLAREQGALAWELRAAMSLARLRVRQDRRELAREILAPIYAAFIEGFETTDLIAARGLLEELSPH